MMTCPNTYYHAVVPFITVLIWVPLSRQVRFHHLIFPQVLAESAKLYLNYSELSQLKSEMAVLFKHLAQKRRYVVAPEGQAYHAWRRGTEEIGFSENHVQFHEFHAPQKCCIANGKCAPSGPASMLTGAADSPPKISAVFSENSGQGPFTPVWSLSPSVSRGRGSLSCELNKERSPKCAARLRSVRNSFSWQSQFNCSPTVSFHEVAVRYRQYLYLAANLMLCVSRLASRC